MRATINFEIDMENVSQVMLALSQSETDNIRAAAHVLATATPENLESKLAETATELSKSLRQLEQYRSMLLSFSRAKLETMLPQPAPEAAIPVAPPLGEQLESLSGFGDFMNRLEEGDEPDSKEG